jgi:hypothetical protein
MRSPSTPWGSSGAANLLRLETSPSLAFISYSISCSVNVSASQY